MSRLLTQKGIIQLCGRFSYEKGKDFYQSRRVTLRDYHPETFTYEAIVAGKNKQNHYVTVRLAAGEVEASCTCPSLSSYDQYCQHTAAVLLQLMNLELDGELPGQTQQAGREREQLRGTEQDRNTRSYFSRNSQRTPDERYVTDSILKLFEPQRRRPTAAGTHVETRATLDVEFTCRVVPHGYRKHFFSLEIKLGPKRLYIVQNIRDFLERIERREPYEFSRHFTYDPSEHCFTGADDAVLKQLVQILRQEKIYRDTLESQRRYASQAAENRQLMIPPFAWDTMQPILAAAPNVKLVYEEATYTGIHVATESLPLHFEFDQSEEGGYQMRVKGIERLLVLDAYGLVLVDGKLRPLSGELATRLSGLKQLLDSAQQQLTIPQEQMEPFMKRVAPGLMKLGQVQIAPTVSEKIMREPLQAKIYLDRVKDRLLAGIEFQYGDLTMNPLESKDQAIAGERILMRDSEREEQILSCMEQAQFGKTEGGYFLEDEEAEYHFLYHIVPQLEKLARVYATSAVKVRLHKGSTPPQIKVDIDERTNWLEFTFRMEGIPESEIRQLVNAVEEKRRYYRMPTGAFLPLEEEELQDMVRLINEMGVTSQLIHGSTLRLPITKALHLMDSESRLRSLTMGRSLRRFLDNLRNPDNLDFPVPPSLVSILRDYQVFGYQWLKTLAHYRFGGILADDMGLGKTLQSIAFLLSVLPEIREQGLPAMIVAPASLVYNWANELAKFAPELRAVIVDGSKDERSNLLKAKEQPDIIITSYPLLRRDIKSYQDKTFHTLIMDEAQMFKNHTTQTAQAVKAIQSMHRFALTGTPVENRLEELWSIYDVVFPELFTSRKAFNELTREVVAKRIRPFLLRRLKKDVLAELPEKIETLQASELLPDQKKLYLSYLAKLKQDTLKHLDEEGFHKSRIRILAGITRLRQLCCHPALFVEEYEGSSAKFEQLFEILEECRGAGKRVLVFSQFTEMLGLIGNELGYLGVPFLYLDGQTPAAERVELCDRFNAGESDLFLMSLKAGGTGLNLTGADTVILYDLWWNPAVEQQAADRAHRIGQKNVVQVIRLVAQGTVEEKMYELQRKKLNLIEEVIQPGQEVISSLTEEEIREILAI